MITPKGTREEVKKKSYVHEWDERHSIVLYKILAKIQPPKTTIKKIERQEKENKIILLK